MSDLWIKVKCPKCSKEFGGSYREGTYVFCNPCARWVPAEKEEDNGEGSKVRQRKAKV